MRRILSFLVLVMLPLVAGSVTRTVVYAPADLEFSRVGEYDVVELRGYPAMVVPGAPRMPRVVEPLLIPAGAVPLSVEVLVEEWVDLPGVYNIYPSQPDRPLSVPEGVYGLFYEPDPKVYSMVTEYPGFGVRLAGVGNMNGYRIAHIELFPLQYIPASGVLRLATRIIYRVEYLEHQVSDVVATERQLEVFGQAVRAHVVNPEDIVYCAPRVAGSGFGLSLVPPGYYEYVVVSESPIDTVFQRLVDWKTKKGVPGTVVLMSWINSNYTGYDLAEKLRNFIIDARDNWGTIYVLLGGSGDYNSSGQNIVPTRKGWYTSAGGPDGDYLPADLYYSDLDGDWDFDGDHTYGELTDSVDMYADVYVGRASVYNVGMAQNFVYKMLTYELSPPTDYIERLMLPTAILWSSYEERPMQDSIARMAPSGWRISKMYERNGNLSRQGMIDTMNVGYNFGHWEGHGDQNGIYMGGPYLTSGDADGLVNGDRVGIANSIACMCGGWDLMSSGADCFAEHLVNRVGGGLAVAMMNARYGWGAYVGGYVPGPSERIDTTFYAKLFTEQMHILGQVHHAAKDAWVYYADSGQQYDKTRWCIYELNLFGEPELPLWTDVPMSLTVSYPGVIPIGNQNVGVTVTSSGSPVDNALVCLWKGTETYASGYTNGAGYVSLNVEPLTPGQMLITATARNHYPFEDSLFVQASNYPYVTFMKCSVSDPGPGGNNNGELNPGESVQIPLWVRNWGQTTGYGVTGSLGTGDVYATLSDTLKSFGDIPADDSAYTGADGYDLDIAASCPNGHAILFTLTCKDNADSTWSSEFVLSVYAPVLTYQDYSVVGGNGNGILDPGETADLVVTLENTGGAAAANITSTLSTSSSYITINDASGNFGTIDPGNQGDNSSDPYNVTASPSTPYGTEIDFQIEVASGIYIDTLDFTLVVGQLVPSDTGLYYSYYSGGPHLQSPVFDWFAIDSTQSLNPGTSTNIGDDAVVQVNLPFAFTYYGIDYTQLTIGSDGWVAMGYQTQYDQTNSSIPNSDGPSAMVAGLWDDLDPGNSGQPSDVYYYHDAVSDRFIVEWFRVEHWPSGYHETFEIILYDPVVYPTPTGDGEIIVQYLVEMQESDNTLGIENYAETVGIQYYLDGGYHVLAVPVTDSFAIKYTTYPPDWIGVEEQGGLVNIPMKTMLGALYPNPGIRVMSIRYQIASASDVSLCIYDAAGRLVRTVVSGKCEPGFYTRVWDVRDDQARRVPAGVYFVRLVTDDYQRTEKAVLLK
jgi:hypothetical protein